MLAPDLWPHQEEIFHWEGGEALAQLPREAVVPHPWRRSRPAAWLKGLQEDFLSAPDQVTLLSCFPYHLSLGCTCWEQKSIGGIGEQMWTRAQRKPRSPSSLMRHWYLSEQGAQEQHLCLLPVGSLVVAGIQSLQTLVRLLYYLTSLLLRKNSIKMEMLKTEDPAVGCSIIPSCSVKMW
ncbi:uncharacterized protein LOC121107592 isoform X2 [Gallus gallus]|uniref:uncharacterized protein LOC121107592 isoform X2 n=1 Tax=Gallus gallus TaxID=9031 RepID=UPI001F01B549|nr:uncharacterized protein LOC121107592 isoform X2 [Gallus gallus]